MATIQGLHHVTAIASDAQANYNFYSGLLGLRMVKKTVNFDDPGSYHFYFGDEQGSPGTIMTFFIWPGFTRGRSGTGQVSFTSFSVSTDSIDFWKNRLEAQGTIIESENVRLGEPVIAFSDPDGLKLELIGSEQDIREGWGGSDVPTEHSIKGFHSVTLCLSKVEETGTALVDAMGYAKSQESADRVRYESGAAGAGGIVDLTLGADLFSVRGGMGAGAVHHVAFRTPDDAQQSDIRDSLIAKGFQVSPIMDRTYFHSIYFREPGGVLFEIATDAPGFALDESLAELGRSVKLPSWLESRRVEIESILPSLRTE